VCFTVSPVVVFPVVGRGSLSSSQEYCFPGAPACSLRESSGCTLVVVSWFRGWLLVVSFPSFTSSLLSAAHLSRPCKAEDKFQWVCVLRHPADRDVVFVLVFVSCVLFLCAPVLTATTLRCCRVVRLCSSFVVSLSVYVGLCSSRLLCCFYVSAVR